MGNQCIGNQNTQSNGGAVVHPQSIHDHHLHNKHSGPNHKKLLVNSEIHKEENFQFQAPCGLSKATEEKTNANEVKSHETWTGKLIEGKKEGRGTLLLKNGLRYEGFWNGDLLNGKGKMLCTRTGNKYEGEFKDNKFNGFGIFIWKDGTTYQGNWVDDRQSGYGEEQNADGTRYEGHYFNGRKHGKGIQHYCSGEVYIGEFSKDRLHGWGEYRWPDEKKYIGGWYNGMMNGEGELVVPDESEKALLQRKFGVWSMGRLVSLRKEIKQRIEDL